MQLNEIGSGNGYGFNSCDNLINCEGKGHARGINLTNNSALGYGFRQCTGVVNCIGTGTTSGTVSGNGVMAGYGFDTIEYATNCKDGGSTTGMWNGINKNIDTETCRKTSVTANNATLNA